MFYFEVKDLERLYISKIKYDPDNFPTCCKYLYIQDNKMIFIKQNKKKYFVCGSGNTGLKPFRTTRVFDIYYITEDLVEAINQFKSAVYEVWSKF